MSNGDDSLIHLIHTIWSGALTVLAGALIAIVKWNWTKLSDKVEQIDKGKVDKDALELLRDDLKERWRSQDQLQVLASKRLDDIFHLIATGKFKE
jgi:hypothetical protein